MDMFLWLIFIVSTFIFITIFLTHLDNHNFEEFLKINFSLI